jgi:hypothetical protein
VSTSFGICCRWYLSIALPILFQRRNCFKVNRFRITCFRSRSPATVTKGGPRATSFPAAISVVPLTYGCLAGAGGWGQHRYRRAVYIFSTRFVLGRLGSSLAAMWRRREPLLCINSGGLVVIDDVVFDGGFVCGRSILLLFSFLFGGGGRFSGAVFGELWRLVSFAFGGGDLWSLAVRLLRVAGLCAGGG